MDPVSKAQASGISEKSKANLRPWKKGQSGNVSGRPKKNHVTRMFEKILANPSKRKEIAESVMNTLTSKGMAKVLMLREIAERTEGKVVETVEMNVTGRVELAEVIERRRKKRADSESRA